MMIPVELRTLIDKILELNHTLEEWEKLEREAETLLKNANAEQQDYFAESGAGEALYMACSQFSANDQSCPKNRRK